RGVVLRDEGVVATRARVPPQATECGAGDVDASIASRGTEPSSRLRSGSAELAGPQGGAPGGAPSPPGAREAPARAPPPSRARPPDAAGGAAAADAAPAGAPPDAIDVVMRAGAELAGPQGGAPGVVLRHEGIVPARAGAPQTAECGTSNVDVARRVHPDATDL